MPVSIERFLQGLLANPWTWLIGLVALVVVQNTLTGLGRRRRKDPAGPRDMRDPKAQVDAVSRVDFQRIPLMNKGEYRVFVLLERALPDVARGYRLMAQTNLSEILRPDTRTPEPLRTEAFASINSKRVDFVIIDASGRAALAVEVQGSGHYLGGTAFIRDAVKKEVLRRAGVPLLEVTPEMQSGEIIEALRRVIGNTAELRRPA